MRLINYFVCFRS